MLQVGIHDKVSLVSVSIESQKTDESRKYLSLVFSQIDPEASEIAVDESGLNDFNSSEVTSSSANNSTKISLWGASVMINGTVIEPKKVREKLILQKDSLTHLLEGYMPKSEIKWDLFAGMNLPADPLASKAAIEKMMTSQIMIDKITSNINTQFILMFNTVSETNHLNEFRLKFCRTSKAKNYPSFPNSAYGFPFWESMVIPAALSKVKFTKSEIDYGSDKADQVKAESNTTTVGGDAATEAYGTL